MGGRVVFWSIPYPLVLAGAVLAGAALGGALSLADLWARPVQGGLSEAVSGRVVVIDPGHGGPDPGAVGRAGTLEKHVVLGVARALRPLLQRAAVRVVLSREDDRDLAGPEAGRLGRRKREDLERRALLANESGADLFVSLHANSFPSPIWAGAQTFYLEGHPGSQRLAEVIQEELVRRVGPNRRKARPGDYRVLRESRMPAAVVELGFLSNPREEELLNDPAYQRRLAEALYHGIVRYLAEPAAPAPPPPAAAVGPAPQAAADELILYFQSPLGDEGGLVPVSVPLPAGLEVEEKALRAVYLLVAGPEPGSLLLATLPPQTPVREVRVEGNLARVDFGRELSEGFWGGGLSEMLTVYSLVNTLAAIPGIDRVQLSVEGDSRVSLGGHLDLDRPLAPEPGLVETGSRVTGPR